MDDVGPQPPRSRTEMVERKKRKRVFQHARCPYCCERVVIPDDKEPDRMVEIHTKNDCWWVKSHGFVIHKDSALAEVVSL